MPSFRAPELTDFVTRLFADAGVPGDEARIVSTSLVGANLRGHDSHGVMRVPQYIDFVAKGAYRTGVALKVEHETPAVVACDGQWGFGQVQAHRLVDLIIPKAQALGLSAGSARDCGHIGRLGEYAEKAAESGLILIATVNNNGAGQRVAPPGGIEPRLGTNPLCAAVPTAGDPVVLDFGTSVVAEGKVRVYNINKRPVPEGWLLDPEGRPTTDPSVLYNAPLGSILPMGGAQAYKGFGLGLVLDMLAGGLSGGRSSHPGAPPVRGNNVFFLAIDPAQFAGRDALLRESTTVAEYVRNTPLAPGAEAILLPGDPERRTLERRTAEGIPIEEAHWAKLCEVAARLGTKVPELTPGA
jgi:hydroxycarboxylate dehydrogenase B